MSWMKDKDWKKPSPGKCLVDNIMFSVARTVRHTTDCLTRLCSLQHWMSLRVDETNSYQKWLRCNYPCLEAGGFTGWVLPAQFSASVTRICRTGVQAQSCFSPCQGIISQDFKAIQNTARLFSSPQYRGWACDCSPHHPPILWVTLWQGNIKQKMLMEYSHYVNVTSTLKVAITWKGYTDLATKDGFTGLIQL